MMPQLCTVRVQRQDGPPIRLWVPVLPVLLVASPMLAVALLVGIVACLVYRINPVRALVAAWGLLCALRGTRIDVGQGRTAVLVTIS